MKKFLLTLVLLSVLCACGNKKAQVESSVNPTEVDSFVIEQPDDVADSIALFETLLEDSRPKDVDELFDDFIFNYSSDESLQLQRTVFPLPYYKGNTPMKISREEWMHDHLFNRENYYTLLFDSEEDLDLIGDTSLVSVQVEWTYLKERTRKRYYFERKEGRWMLEAINFRAMEEERKEEFVDFYARFSADSLYRANHIADPLRYVTIDPDDEFSILETTLDADRWDLFTPVLPADSLSNINYGQRNDDLSHTKIMKVNGVGNGFSNIFYFRKRAGEWELYRYEDTSI